MTWVRSAFHLCLWCARPLGCGSKLNHQGTAGLSPWFHLPGQAVWDTHNHLSIPRTTLPWLDSLGRLGRLRLDQDLPLDAASGLAAGPAEAIRPSGLLRLVRWLPLLGCTQGRLAKKTMTWFCRKNSSSEPTTSAASRLHKVDFRFQTKELPQGKPKGGMLKKIATWV